MSAFLVRNPLITSFSIFALPDAGKTPQTARDFLREGRLAPTTPQRQMGSGINVVPSPGEMRNRPGVSSA
jgi:hypothetical protein